MTIYERRKQLVKILLSDPGKTIPELSNILGVSTGTVRNDIEALSKEGLLRRVRGGAILLETSDSTNQTRTNERQFLSRVKHHSGAKRTIAAKAAEIIRDGDSILLDASSTVYHMNPFLLGYKNLRIVTNCIESARVLSENLSHTVMLVGGILRANAESVIGPWTDLFLDGLCTRYAFVSCSGFTPESGMTEVDIFEAQFRLKAIQSAGEIIALVDSSKFGEVDLSPSIPTNRINHLYTDSLLHSNWQNRLHHEKIPFTLCQIDQTIKMQKEKI